MLQLYNISSSFWPCWKEGCHHSWWSVICSGWNTANCSIFLVVSVCTHTIYVHILESHDYCFFSCVHIRMIFLGRFIGGLGVGWVWTMDSNALCVLLVPFTILQLQYLSFPTYQHNTICVASSSWWYPCTLLKFHLKSWEEGSCHSILLPWVQDCWYVYSHC